MNASARMIFCAPKQCLFNFAAPSTCSTTSLIAYPPTRLRIEFKILLITLKYSRTQLQNISLIQFLPYHRPITIYGEMTLSTLMAAAPRVWNRICLHHVPTTNWDLTPLARVICDNSKLTRVDHSAQGYLWEYPACGLQWKIHRQS